MKTKIITIAIFIVMVVTLLSLGSCTSTWEFSFPFWGFPFGIIGLALYFLPTIIAAIRRSKGILGIILLNIFAGWTFIGWVIALIWSLVGEKSR